MILKDNLFSITSCQKDEATLTYGVRLHPEWPIYLAHFPGHPITPGVCIVQMVKELLQETEKRSLRLCRAKHIKYMAIISPEETTDLQVTFSAIVSQPDGTLDVQAQVGSGSVVYTKLSATFGS